MPALFKVPSVYEAIDKITAPMRNMGRSVKRFESTARASVARVERGFMKLGRTLNTLAGGFGLTLGLFALFTVIRGGIGTIAEYEQANANLAAVTRASAKDMDLLKQNSFDLGRSTRFTASEVVGLQTELGKLGFSTSEVLDSTASILALAAATNTELPQAAVQVGASIRAYGLAASEAARVTDVFALGVSSSALDMEKLNVSMSKVAPIAKQFGFSIEDTVALMGSLADAGFDASTMATSTRSIILNLADANGKLSKALGGPARTLPEITQAMIRMRNEGIDLADLLDLTDKRSVSAAATFLENAENIDLMSASLSKAEGSAKLMASIQDNTLIGSTKILKSAYDALWISLEKGDGAISKTLKKYVQGATSLLNMFTAANKVDESVKRLDKSLMSVSQRQVISDFEEKLAGEAADRLAEKILFWGQALLWLAGVYGLVKTVLLVADLVRAFQLLFVTNPIGLIIAGIIALSILIAFAIKQWDTWGASIVFLLGPIGQIIGIIQSLRRNWELIGKAFRGGGIISGILSIGLALVDSILMPLEQILGHIEDFTGFDLKTDFLNKLRKGVSVKIQGLAGVEPTGEIQTNTVNPELSRQESLSTSITESVEKKELSININDPEDRTSVDEENTSSGIDVNLVPSFGF